MSEIKRERKRLLGRIESFFEVPMIVLGFIWLALLVVELIHGTSPLFEGIGYVIWGIFIADFLVKFLIAPDKSVFFKANILNLVSLIVPAFRVFRIVRALRIIRVSRSLRLVKVLASLNRGMRSLSATMKRRAFGYVFFLTLIVTFAGAAGIYAFERDVNGGLDSYGTSLWWTTMIMTTLGSEYWPRTTEGRILCIVLSLYAFAVFGYLTATIATFFIGRDADDKQGEIAGSQQLEELRREVVQLKAMIRSLADKASSNAVDVFSYDMRGDPRGSFTKNVAPLPSAPSAQMLPPCRSTIFRQSDNPSPVPSYRLLGFNRINVSKMLAASC